MPITRPFLFQISPYGGNKPTASKMEAMMPTTSTGVSFPARYIGWLSTSEGFFTTEPNAAGDGPKTHPDGQDQRSLDAAKDSPQGRGQQCGRPHAPLSPVDERLGPAEEAQHHEDLRLDLDRDVEVLDYAVDAEGDATECPSVFLSFRGLCQS